MNILKGKIQAFLYICIENYNFQIDILKTLFCSFESFKWLDLARFCILTFV